MTDTETGTAQSFADTLTYVFAETLILGVLVMGVTSVYAAWYSFQLTMGNVKLAGTIAFMMILLKTVAGRYGWTRRIFNWREGLDS